MDEVLGFNIIDKQIVLMMVYMVVDVYVEYEGEVDWEEVGRLFNRSVDFGWQGDGLCGYIFVDQINLMVVIGLKGILFVVFDGDGMMINDKENDNFFFSCCCVQ